MSTISSPAVVSARRSLEVVCRMLRWITNLQTINPHVDENIDALQQPQQPPPQLFLTAEMMRRVKLAQYVATDESVDQRSPRPAHAISPELSEDNIRRCLWRTLHGVICFERTRQNPSNKHAPVPPHSWLQQEYISGAVAYCCAQLHDMGEHILCETSSSSSPHSLPSPDSVTCRRVLIALSSLMARTGMFEQILAAWEQEAQCAWFAPPFHTAAVNLPSSFTSQRSKKSAATSTLIPQPLLNPALWDSASTHAAFPILEQSQEYRLLQQLLKSREGTANHTCLPITAASSPQESSTSPYSRRSLGSQQQQQQQSFVPSAVQRLTHRVQQCLVTQGKITAGLKKLEELQRRQAKAVAQLQLVQHHVALRGATAAPFSPFEVQLLHSPMLQQTISNELLSWLQELDPQLVADDGTATATSSWRVKDYESCIQVFWQWMESVAAVEVSESQLLQQQTQEEEAAAEADGMERQTARSRAKQPSSGSASARALSSSTSQKRRLAAATSNASATASSSASTASAMRDLLRDLNATGAESSQQSLPTEPTSHILQSLLSRSVGFSSKASAVPQTVSWHENTQVLADLIEQREQSLSALRTRNNAAVEQSILSASKHCVTKDPTSNAQDPLYVGFTVHT